MSTALTGLDVPFLDLHPMHEPIKNDVLDAVSTLIDSGAFINGPQVREFEEAFARYVGTSAAVGLASGLDALRLALLAAGIQPGDEVVVPANTFVATLEAVTQAGGVPVVVDMSDADWNLDIDAVADAITPATRFVMPVHLYGQMADMSRLRELADRHQLDMVEDACQAHGADRDGLRAGTVGLAAGFSFYPGKNLGAFGDAGALTTNDATLADEARALREHGQRVKYKHHAEGYTARLDTIQAIVLGRKLVELDRWTEERRAVAAFYLAELSGVGDLELPPVARHSNPVWHLFVVRTEDPEALSDHLRAAGIGSGRHYPEPVHLSGAYGSLGYSAGDFPRAERHAATALSLPIFPGMTMDQVDAVATSVRAFFSG
jgi:dTDP-4-amino-4,6-dideoxygalactose transaminase